MTGDPVDEHLTYPPGNDLRRLLRFEPDTGSIWLGERRMVLLHTAARTHLERKVTKYERVIRQLKPKSN